MAIHRRTKQRDAIIEQLEKSVDFRSARQIHLALLAEGSNIGLATVYRNLQVLHELGSLDMIRHEEGEALYRLCNNDIHHHHLVCRECGKTVDVAAEEVEVWVEQVTKRYGFTQVEHSADMFGLCDRCS